MEKFPECLGKLGMCLEIDVDSLTIVTVWEEERIVCMGVGSDLPDALRRAEPWFWEEMVDRKLEELLINDL